MRSVFDPATKGDVMARPKKDDSDKNDSSSTDRGDPFNDAEERTKTAVDKDDKTGGSSGPTNGA